MSNLPRPSLFEHNFIDGAWVRARGDMVELHDPVTEEVGGSVRFSTRDDVDDAVAAATRAFETFVYTTPGERGDLLRAVVKSYESNADELADAVVKDIGCPITRATAAQVPLGWMHIAAAADAIATIDFEEEIGPHLITREPAGVAGMITPWNWPYNQIAAKVGAAIAAGCTMVLKPSELAPRSAEAFARVMIEAGVPPGVFNLVHGAADAGQQLSSHADVDIMSFTGSVPAGVAVSRAAADTVKRVTLELGGKSANILLPDVDVEDVVTRDFHILMSNSAQSCTATTRMIVPRDLVPRVLEALRAAAEQVIVGDPRDPATEVGPLVSSRQFDRVQDLISAAIATGAPIVAGGTGRPAGLDRGFYVRPTVFGPVENSLAIAKEEVFGPVLCVVPYDTVEDAIRIANDSVYGLGGAVSSRDSDAALAVARRLRTGMVNINGAWGGVHTPFGGYRQSGNGREGGVAGVHEFLEAKTIARPGP